MSPRHSGNNNKPQFKQQTGLWLTARVLGNLPISAGFSTSLSMGSSLGTLQLWCDEKPEKKQTFRHLKDRSRLECCRLAPASNDSKRPKFKSEQKWSPYLHFWRKTPGKVGTTTVFWQKYKWSILHWTPPGSTMEDHWDNTPHTLWKLDNTEAVLSWPPPQFSPSQEVRQFVKLCNFAKGLWLSIWNLATPSKVMCFHYNAMENVLKTRVSNPECAHCCFFRHCKIMTSFSNSI